jgi:hypothetical protein
MPNRFAAGDRPRLICPHVTHGSKPSPRTHVVPPRSVEYHRKPDPAHQSFFSSVAGAWQYFFSHSSRLKLPGYEHVGQALRFCDFVLMKAVPARTCTAREFGLGLGEQTLNTSAGFVLLRATRSAISSARTGYPCPDARHSRQGKCEDSCGSPAIRWDPHR